MEHDGSGPLDMDFTPGPTHAPEHVHHVMERKKRNKRILLIALMVLAGLMLVAGVAVLVLKHTPKKAAPTAGQTTGTSSETQSSEQSSSTLKTYQSAALKVSFSYPSNWTVKESADKAEVIVGSPRITYTKKDGSSATGSFVVKMRHGAIPDAIQQNVIKMVAVSDSLVIAYDKPTAVQRQYTNISYGGTDANTFTTVIVSGNASLKAGQAFGYNVDLTGADTYMFAGGYGADTTDTLSFDPVGKTTYDSATFQDAIGIIKSVQVN